jgi:hypothetical protein
VVFFCSSTRIEMPLSLLYALSGDDAVVVGASGDPRGRRRQTDARPQQRPLAASRSPRPWGHLASSRLVFDYAAALLDAGRGA